MSFIKSSCNLYPDFAGTVHTASIFEAFSSKILYRTRKELTSEFTDKLQSNKEGLFIQNNFLSMWPSSITEGLEENKRFMVIS